MHRGVGAMIRTRQGGEIVGSNTRKARAAKTLQCDEAIQTSAPRSENFRSGGPIEAEFLVWNQLGPADSEAG